MYLAGVSVRRVEDVTELLWGSRVSASTVSNLNQKVYGKIEECWHNAPLFLQKKLDTTFGIALQSHAAMLRFKEPLLEGLYEILSNLF